MNNTAKQTQNPTRWGPTQNRRESLASVSRNVSRQFSDNMKRPKLTVPIIIGIVVAAVTGIGIVGALNGWFGGGASIPTDTMTRGLVGFWNFDGGTGPLVADNSGQGNDGMINDGGSGNPVSYWTFDEGTGQYAYDYVGSNNGTRGADANAGTDDPTWTSSGRVGGAMEFDGSDDYVDVGYNASYDVVTEISIELWVKDAAGPEAINRDDFTGTGVRIWKVGRGTVGKFIYEFFGTGNGGYVSSVGTYDTTQWHHVVATFKNEDSRALYVDGELDTSEGVTGTLIQSSSLGIRMMARLDGGTFMPGFIDDVRIYDYARGAAQIKRDYLESYKSKYSDGKVGGGMEFDGVDDYVEIADNSDLRLTGNFTIEFWTKLHSYSTSWQALIDKRTPPTWEGYHVAVDPANNKLRFHSSSSGNFHATTAPTLDRWYFCTVIFNGTTYKWYVNGDFETSTDASPLESSTKDLLIGAGNNPTVGGEPANTLIDEVRIYNRALTAAEVRFHYNRGGPVAHWKFDEGSGYITLDETDNDNDGTLGSSTEGDSAEPTWTTGKYGTALEFDGVDDYVNIDTIVSDLSSDTAGTIELWMYSENDDSGYPMMVTFGDTDSSTAIFFDLYLGKLRAAVYVSGSYSWNIMTDSAIDDYQKWLYVTLVQDGTGPVLYINGEKPAQTFSSYSDKTKWFTGASGIDNGRIGCDNLDSYGDDLFFKGIIDDVRIYNYARTAGEIRLDYNAGFSVRFGGSPADDMTRGLVGYWNFDEQGSPLAFDQSDYGNDGMINDGGSGNPVSYWTFDEGTGTTATDYIGSNNGTLNGPTWTSSGRVGGALDFDGSDDYVDCGTDSSFDVTAVTVEAWFKTSSIAQQVIAGNWETSRGYKLMSGNNGNVLFYSDGNGNYWGTSVADGKWHHIAATITGTTKKGYIDGIEVYTVSEGLTTVSTLNFYIGANNSATPSQLFDGLIDDVRIYDYARDAAQIKRDYLESYKSKYSEGAPCLAGATCGGGLSFDGVDDFVDCGSDASLQFGSGDFSIEAWIKRDDVTNYDGIASRNTAVDYKRSWVFRTDNANNKLALSTNDDGLGGGFATTETVADVITVGNWHHVVVVKSGTEATFYVDGSVVADDGVASKSSLYATTYPLKIGGTDLFDGLIDEVRIYNRALSAEEVRYHYNRGGPVAYWKFDEGSGITAYDETNNDNDGTLGGDGAGTDLPTWTSGKYGSALSFDGSDDYIKITDPGANSSLDITTTVTLGAWIKTAQDASHVRVLEKGGYDSGEYALEVHSGKVGIEMFGLSPSSTHGASDVNDNEWHHIVGVWDGSNKKHYVYVDGVQETSKTVTGSYTADNEDVSIGSRLGTGYFFNGLIDDVRIYNYARSASEIRTDYNEGFAARFGGSPADDMTRGLVGYWNMDEGDGQFAYDQSDYDNTGYARPYGKALSFDGVNDYVETAEKIDVSSGFSVVMWWKREGDSGGGTSDTYHDLMLAINGYTYNRVRVTKAGTTIRAEVMTDSVNRVDSTSVSNPDNWHQVGMIWDGSKVYYVLDGVRGSGSTATGALESSTASVRFGRLSNVYYIANGLMKDARIYNRALSITEVAECYKGIYSDESGLVGYWPFNKSYGTTAYDESGNGNHGTLGDGTCSPGAGTCPTWENNMPQWSEGAPAGVAGGSAGGAMQFDGVDDYVNVSDSDVLDTIRTFEAWVYVPEGLSDATAYHGLVTKEDSSTVGLAVRYSTSPNQFRASWKDSNSDSSQVFYSIPAYGEWYHLVAMLNSDMKTELFVNGISQGTDAVLADNQYAEFLSDPVRMGSSQEGRESKATIDEVRIYNRALSSEEIRYHYNRGGPVAHWKFDEGSGTIAYDSTNNNNDGTLEASMTNDDWVTGKLGTALSFDGTDDYVSVAESTSLKLTDANNITLEAWVKLNNVSGLKQVIGRFDAAGGTRFYLLRVRDNTAEFYLSDDGTWDTTYQLLSTSTFSANVWTHIVAVSDGTMRLYINGVADANTKTPPVSIGDGTEDIYIGSEVGTGNYFDGLIDDVRIYNYARTQEQILIDYNAGLATHFK